MDGMLSQEEINALLGGMGDSAENTSDVVANEPVSYTHLTLPTKA